MIEVTNKIVSFSFHCQMKEIRHQHFSVFVKKAFDYKKIDEDVKHFGCFIT